MLLTAERVDSIYQSCLFTSQQERKELMGEIVKEEWITKGIITSTFFHPERIKQHHKEIYDLLKELPDAYLESGGGGMSFLNACYDKHGNQWTGIQTTMDRLFQLGIAIGKVEYVFDDRDLWSILPGGVPYLIIKDKDNDNTAG